MLSSKLTHRLVKPTVIDGTYKQKFFHLSYVYLYDKKNERVSNRENPPHKSNSLGNRRFNISKIFKGSSNEKSIESEYKATGRKWVSFDSAEKTTKKSTTFLVMSYNILSQFYVHLHQNLYAKNDPADMQWEYRLNALRSEICDISPDILCLQEVQNNHLEEIKEKLKGLGFDEPLYKKRNGSQVDGCAIFFKKSLFDLVECHHVEYYQPNIRVLNRCNVAIIAKLSLKTNQNVQFIVSTTHLLFNPRRHDIRLAQVQILLAELNRLAHNYEIKSKNRTIPIILTGDFNFQQDSKPYHLIIGEPVNVDSLFKTTFQIRDKLLPMELGITDNCQHYHVVISNRRDQTALYCSANNSLTVTDGRRTVLSKSSSKPIIKIEELMSSGLPFNTGTLKTDLNLASTLDLYNEQNEPMASTFHHRWIKVDYIFYSKSIQEDKLHTNLKLLGAYELPSVNECIETGVIPNKTLGSDHYSMAARFTITDNE